MKKTACEDCDFVHMDTRKQHPSRWMCVQAPRLIASRRTLGLVAPKYMRENPNEGGEPYRRCVDVNIYERCKLFKSRREGKIPK